MSNNTELLQCPCGEVPKEFDIWEYGGAGYIEPLCCNTWGVRFMGCCSDDDFHDRAYKAWNAAPRHHFTTNE